jgi:hypothetical protein
MQIHEITYKKINEGFASGFFQGAGINTTGLYTGGDTESASNASAQSAATQVNKPLVQALVKQANEAWTKTQQELASVARPPVASAAELPETARRQPLTELITKLIGINGDYKTFPSTLSASASDDGSAEAGAEQAVLSVDNGIAALLAANRLAPKQAQAARLEAWNDIIQNGVQPLRSYAQFAKQQQSKTSLPGATVISPQSQQLAKTMGQQSMNALGAEVKGKTIASTNNPTIDGLLTAAGAKVS